MEDKVKEILHPECYGVGIGGYPCPIPNWGDCRKCDEIARQICQLFEPDRELLLTPEEFRTTLLEDLCPRQLAKATSHYTKLIEQARKDERQQTIRELREHWAWDHAQGAPVFSMRFDKWIEFAKDAGLSDENWWELKEKDNAGKDK